MALERETDAMEIDQKFREMLIAIVRFGEGDDVERCVQVLRTEARRSSMLDELGEYAAAHNPNGHTEADVPQLIQQVRAEKSLPPQGTV